MAQGNADSFQDAEPKKKEKKRKKETVSCSDRQVRRISLSRHPHVRFRVWFDRIWLDWPRLVTGFEVWTLAHSQRSRWVSIDALLRVSFIKDVPYAPTDPVRKRTVCFWFCFVFFFIRFIGKFEGPMRETFVGTPSEFPKKNASRLLCRTQMIEGDWLWRTYLRPSW